MTCDVRSRLIDIVVALLFKSKYFHYKNTLNTLHHCQQQVNKLS